MPLYIRNGDVDELVAKVQALTRAPTKTEAVRLALQHELERQQAGAALSSRLAKAIAMTRAIGIRKGSTEDFDMKAFTDEMWGC